MANFVYTAAKEEIMKGTVDFDLPDDFRVILVDSTTTADTEEDALTVGGFTTLGELSGTGYTSGGDPLVGDAVNRDDPNNRAEYDATDTTWTGINAGTAQAAILIKWITNLTSSLPIAYIDTGGFPITTNGGDLTIQWNAEGVLQLT